MKYMLKIQPHRTVSVCNYENIVNIEIQTFQDTNQRIVIGIVIWASLSVFQNQCLANI